MVLKQPDSAELTLVAVLTPDGRGAVATIGVRGPQAIEIVSRRFSVASSRALAEFAAGQVAFGRLVVTDNATEEVVIGIVGTQEVEIHCHGGIAAANAVIAALASEGAIRIDWQHWALASGPDFISTEAAIALADAKTERTATILLDQYRGALAAAIQRGDNPAALLARAELGRHLTQPWRVVLCGRPNVGKSTLINALLGYARAITHDEPGTTRDVLSAPAAFDGWPVVLSDTAGVRTSQGVIETEGVARAKDEIAAADVVLLVCDASDPWTATDEQLWNDVQSLARPSGVQLIVHNKCDLAPPPTDGRPTGLAVSALSRAGLTDLERAIGAAIVPDPPPQGAAVPFTERQLVLLHAAQAAARRGDTAQARDLLQQVREKWAQHPSRICC